MSYRPQVKSDSNGTTQDLPLDAETVQGKTPVFTTTNQTISGVKTYTDTQTFKGGLTLYAESGDSPRLTFQRGTLIDTYKDWSLYGGSDGYLYIQQSGSSGYETRAKFTTTGVEFAGTIKEDGIHLADKYSPISHSHESVLDYGDTSKTIKIGYSGAGLTASQISYIAGYTSGANDSEHKIKDISKDVLKSWLGYAEVATGKVSQNSDLSNMTDKSYFWIIYPYNPSSSSFTFTAESSSYTAYQFAVIQGGTPGSIRYFKSTTTLGIVQTTTIRFNVTINYVRFKIQ